MALGFMSCDCFFFFQLFALLLTYISLDLSTPTVSINRVDPEWTVTELGQYLDTINAFLKYDNVLAFNVANEVVAQINVNPNASQAGPYIKAATRDVKAFLKSKNSSALGSS